MTVSTRCVTSLGCAPSRGVSTNVIAVTRDRAGTDALREGPRLRLVHRARQGDRVLAVRREAARHHDRARPHGLDVPAIAAERHRAGPGLHRPQLREAGHEDVPDLLRRVARPDRAGGLPADAAEPDPGAEVRGAGTGQLQQRQRGLRDRAAVERLRPLVAARGDGRLLAGERYDVLRRRDRQGTGGARHVGPAGGTGRDRVPLRRRGQHRRHVAHPGRTRTRTGRRRADRA